MKQENWDLGTSQVKLILNGAEGTQIKVMPDNDIATKVLEMADNHRWIQARFITSLLLTFWAIAAAIISTVVFEVSAHTVLGTTLGGLICATAIQHHRLARARERLERQLRAFCQKE